MMAQMATRQTRMTPPLPSYLSTVCPQRPPRLFVRLRGITAATDCCHVLIRPSRSPSQLADTVGRLSLAHVDPARLGIEVTRALGLAALLFPEQILRFDRQTLRRIAMEERPSALRSAAPIPVAQETLELR
jgi:hypothetical protein